MPSQICLGPNFSGAVLELFIVAQVWDLYKGVPLGQGDPQSQVMLQAACFKAAQELRSLGMRWWTSFGTSWDLCRLGDKMRGLHGFFVCANFRVASSL